MVLSTPFSALQKIRETEQYLCNQFSITKEKVRLEEEQAEMRRREAEELRKRQDKEDRKRRKTTKREKMQMELQKTINQQLEQERLEE